VFGASLVYIFAGWSTGVGLVVGGKGGEVRDKAKQEEEEEEEVGRAESQSVSAMRSESEETA